MSSDQPVGRFTIGELIKSGAIHAHKDGNFGSLYPKIEDFVEDGYPLLTAKVVNDGRIDFDAAQKLSREKAALLKYGFIQSNDVLLSHNATVGRVAVVPDFRGCALIGTSLTYFRLDQTKLLPRYLAAFFEGRDFQNQLSAVMGLSTRNQVPITAQRLLEVEVPNIREQHKISDFVGSVDDRIALLRETNATLEAIAQALFKSWFVDFDPVRAKMDGRAPEGMDEATAGLFPDSFEETELGAVPRGWRYQAIREVVEGVYDGPHATPPEATTGGVFLGIKNLTGTALDLTEVRHIADADWAQWTKRVTPRHLDVVFSYEATLGFFALVPPGLRCCLGRRLALVRPKQEDGGPHFWFHQFIGQPFQQLLDKHTIHGATVNRIALKSFPDLQVLVPSIELIRAFDRLVAPIWQRIHVNLEKVQTLATLRDTLLPRLISGQLRLPEAQAELEAA